MELIFLTLINIIITSLLERLPFCTFHTNIYQQSIGLTQRKYRNIKKAIFKLHWNKGFENPSTNGKNKFLNESLLTFYQIISPSKKDIVTFINLNIWLILHKSSFNEDVIWQNFTKMYREKLLMIKYWKNLQSTQGKYLKLKWNTF